MRAHELPLARWVDVDGSRLRAPLALYRVYRHYFGRSAMRRRLASVPGGEDRSARPAVGTLRRPRE